MPNPSSIIDKIASLPSLPSSSARANTLLYNAASGRFVIGERELHCGDCVKLRIDGKWHKCRIELDDRNGWFFVGLPNHFKQQAQSYLGYMAD